MKTFSLVIALSLTAAGCAGSSADDLRDDASAPGTDATAPTTGATAPASGDPVRRATPEAKTPPARPVDPTPEYREVTIPSGTALAVTLQSPVASDTSSLEDPVRATLRRPVAIDGIEALPAGTPVLGHVTSANRSAKVKGRASVAFRFNEVDLPGDGGRLAISTGTISRAAPATKKEDAAKIGVGAAGGAVIGGVLGGGGGAAKGAAIGGAAGTGVVLSTRGKEVRLAQGTSLTVRLTAPLTLRLRR